ncbi:MAG: hypothetical protein EOO38_09415, partial [Cytophagaceae bacterium]
MTTAEIARPSLLQSPLEQTAYTNDNLDKQVKLVNAWKNKSGWSVRSDFGMFKGRTKGFAESYNSILSASSSTWDTKSTQGVNTLDQDLAGNISSVLDKGKKTIFQTHVSVRIRKANSFFDMSTTGDVSDSSRELLKRHALSLNGNWKLTKKISNNTFLIWKGSCSFIRSEENFSVSSDRMAGFFSFDNERVTIGQRLNPETSKFQSSLGIVRNWKGVQASSAVSLVSHERTIGSNVTARLVSKDSVIESLDSVMVKLTLSKVDFKQGILWRVSKGTEITGTASLGAGLIVFPTGRQLVWTNRALVTFLKRLSPFRSLSISLDFNRSTTPVDEIFAGPVFSGTATVIYGLDTRFSPKLATSITGAYLAANVFRGKQILLNLSYSRTEGENITGQTLDPKPTDVGHLVHGMQDLIKRSVGPAIDLQISTDPALWPARVDAGQLDNALLNLCINARDAMPDGGQLVVRASNQCLSNAVARDHGLVPGDYLCLSVRDTGVGMSPAVIARAFEPFYTTKPLGEGTGLGLSMVYGFAQQSGGQLKIQSEVGHGTSMLLYLPRHLGEATGIH